MANPNVTDSASQFTSQAFLDPYSIFMPQNRKQLLGFQNEDYFMTDIFEALQMAEPVEGKQWYTWVEPKKIETIISSAAVGAGATDTPVVVAVKATPSIASGNFARRGDRYRQASTGNIYLVETVSALNVTFVPSAGTNVAAIAANESFVLVDNAYPEAADPRTGMTGKARQIQNQLQLIQGTALASGSVQGDKTWFDITPEMGLGIAGKYWFSWEVKAERDRMIYQQNNTMLVGQKLTYNLTTPANWGSKAQSTVVTTGGLISQATGEGSSLGYSAGEPSMQWFFKVINLLIANQGDKENIMFGGMQWEQANIGWMLDQFKNGAITFGSFNQDAELAIKLGFKSFETAGYTFHNKSLSSFNNPDGLGSQGFGANAILIPSTPIKTSTGDLAKPVRMRYKPMQGGKMMAVGFRNSTRNNSAPTSGGDYDSMELITEFGIEALAPWKMLWIYKQ